MKYVHDSKTIPQGTPLSECHYQNPNINNKGGTCYSLAYSCFKTALPGLASPLSTFFKISCWIAASRSFFSNSSSLSCSFSQTKFPAPPLPILGVALLPDAMGWLRAAPWLEVPAMDVALFSCEAGALLGTPVISEALINVSSVACSRVVQFPAPLVVFQSLVIHVHDRKPPRCHRNNVTRSIYMCKGVREYRERTHVRHAHTDQLPSSIGYRLLCVPFPLQLREAMVWLLLGLAFASSGFSMLDSENTQKRATMAP
jgi:hypothetical protein